MGSPPIAVATLEALAREFAVALVVTQPDRPSGRGRKIAPTAVHRKANELGLDVLTCADVNSEECVRALQAAKPEAIVVVSFGQILRKRVLELPRAGCLNAHFSLLPALRGAAPVAWALVRGFERTGISIIRMTRRMDAGPIYAQAEEPVRADDTTATLSARLGTAGAGLLVETLKRSLAGECEPVPQDESAATLAPKITRRDAALDWSRPARDVDRLIRGLSGQLEAYAFLDAPRPLRVTFYNSSFAAGDTPGAGIAARGGGGELLVGCGEGSIEVREIQAEGRRRLSGKDFANGYHIAGGERFRNGE
jgi:methionyl-tRNA formyltransferase